MKTTKTLWVATSLLTLILFITMIKNSVVKYIVQCVSNNNNNNAQQLLLRNYILHNY